MTYQHNTDQINQLADKLEDPELASMSGLSWKAAFHLRELQGRIADLEAQLYAIGAGGVGQSIKPPVQDDTAQKPVAWMYERNGRTHITNTDQRPIEHAHPHFKKSKPLYTAPNPARQPLTDEQILSIVRVAPALDTAEAEFLHIARAVEFAHGITGGQP